MLNPFKGAGLAVLGCLALLALAACGSSAPADTIPKKLLVANYAIASTGEAAVSLFDAGVINEMTAGQILLAGEAAIAATKAARAASEACDVVDAAPQAEGLIDDELLRAAMGECDGLTRAMAAVESSLESYRALVGAAHP